MGSRLLYNATLYFVLIPKGQVQNKELKSTKNCPYDATVQSSTFCLHLYGSSTTVTADTFNHVLCIDADPEGTKSPATCGKIIAEKGERRIL